MEAQQAENNRPPQRETAGLVPAFFVAGGRRGRRMPAGTRKPPPLPPMPPPMETGRRGRRGGKGRTARRRPSPMPPAVAAGWLARSPADRVRMVTGWPSGRVFHLPFPPTLSTVFPEKNCPGEGFSTFHPFSTSKQRKPFHRFFPPLRGGKTVENRGQGGQNPLLTVNQKQQKNPRKSGEKKWSGRRDLNS